MTEKLENNGRLKSYRVENNGNYYRTLALGTGHEKMNNNSKTQYGYYECLLCLRHCARQFPYIISI